MIRSLRVDQDIRLHVSHRRKANTMFALVDKQTSAYQWTRRRTCQSNASPVLWQVWMWRQPKRRWRNKRWRQRQLPPKL